MALNLNMNITARDKIIRALVKLQKDQPFFAYILMNFKINSKEAKWVPTAGVTKDGSLLYSEKFVNSLSPAKLNGLLAHEVMHIAKGDWFRMGNRIPELWDIASDAVINHILAQERFELPECGILPDTEGRVTLFGKKYNVNSKSTEQVYDELLDDVDNIQKKLGGFSSQQKSPSGEGEEEGEGEKGNQGNGRTKRQNVGGFDQHFNEPQSECKNQNQRSKWERLTVEASVQARARGNLPGCMGALVDKLLNPVIDWRSIIVKYLTNELPIDYSNRLPGRSFYSTGVWMPRLVRENVEVFVSIDVSGSTIGDRQHFMSETMGILCAYEQVKARVMFWDAELYEENDHILTRENREELTKIEIKDCNGGTEMSCYARYCEKKNYRSRLHIIFTDGYIERDPVVPDGNVIFVLSKGGSDENIKNLGTVCWITDEES